MEKDKKSPVINIAQLYIAYKQHWVWVAVSVIIFLFLGAIFYLRQPDRSEVLAQVLISDETDKPTGSIGELSAMFGGAGAFGSNRSIEDEMVIMKSHSLLEKTVRDLECNVTYKVAKNLVKVKDEYYRPPVKLIYDHSIADTLGVKLKFKVSVNASGQADITLRGRKNRVLEELEGVTLPVTVKSDYGSFTLVPGSLFEKGESFKEYITLESYSSAALSLDEEIVVDYSAKRTDLMLLQYVTTDDAFGRELMDKLIENYNDVTIEQKRAFNRKTLEFLNNRILTLSNEVDSAQHHVQSFIRSKDLVNPGAEASIYLNRTTTQEVELLKAETENELLTMAIEFLGNEANNTSMLPIMPSTASLTPLINGYNSLILERLSIETSAKGSNTALKAINDRIVAVRDNLLTALNKQQETANVELYELKRQFADTKGRLETMPEIQREYANIMRQVNIKEQLYVYLLRQREETEMAIAGAHPRGVIIDEAYISDAVLVKGPALVMGVFFILGLIFPACVILLMWKIGKNVAIADQAVALSNGLPVIAEIPIDVVAEPVVVESPDSTESQRVRLLRSNLLSVVETDSSPIISVNSTTDCDDNMVRVGLNLAASLALAGRKTIIVESNPFNPMLSTVLNQTPHVYLQDILSTPCSPDTLVLKHMGKSLDFVACKSDSSYGVDLISSLDFNKFIARLGTEYDAVVLLGPSVESNFHAVEVLTMLSNVSLYVLEIDKTKKGTMTNIGALVNKCDSYIVDVTLGKA